VASIYDLKPAFQNLLRPLCRGLVRLGISANQVTVSAIVLSFAAGGLVWWWPEERWPLLAVPLALFVRMALNALDGMMAREHDLQTPLGAVLNELGDVLSDTAIYLPLARVPGVRAELIVAVVLLAVISEMTGVIAVQIGASRRYDGPMGKSDRAFVIGATCLLLGLGVHSRIWVDAVLIAMPLLLTLTIVNRARHALRELRA
jgi:CDP-diacylglycerol--glycerol-3-phosphate 3-phosphatidyltransferase